MYGLSRAGADSDEKRGRDRRRSVHPRFKRQGLRRRQSWEYKAPERERGDRNREQDDERNPVDRVDANDLRKRDDDYCQDPVADAHATAQHHVERTLQALRQESVPA